ncbi:MAG: hypothetical protein RIQ99_1463, partial [Pseudomonadota bacterium]
MLPEGVNIAHPDKLYIGGQWVVPHSGRQLEMVSPNTEQVTATCAEADEADMDAAVAAARQAFDHGPWPTTPPAERVAAFRRMVAHLETRVPELAKAWTAQMGGLASFAGPMHGGSVMTLGQIANFAESFQFVEQRATVGAAAGIVVHEPVGVVAAIAPWNGPFGIMANKVAYALLTGCTVV